MEEISRFEFFGKERESQRTAFKLSQIPEENGDTSFSVEESFREGARDQKKAQNDRRKNERNSEVLILVKALLFSWFLLFLKCAIFSLAFPQSVS
ncbi:hypothetical protein LEP1GSC021_2153 [Leptospira noguchii str. 1993005606]|nr:hypothetical protein LEP1GSC021_2153 [Leptospira noguchii str. 1993005606]